MKFNLISTWMLGLASMAWASSSPNCPVSQSTIQLSTSQSDHAETELTKRALRVFPQGATPKGAMPFQVYTGPPGRVPVNPGNQFSYPFPASRRSCPYEYRLHLKKRQQAGFTQQVVDTQTYNNVAYYSKLMSIADCVGRRNGLVPGQTTWSCAECTQINGFELIHVFAATSGSRSTASGYLAADHVNKQLILAFRGSLLAVDLITDLKVVQVPLLQPSSNQPMAPLLQVCPDCKVHKGFYEAYINSYNDIKGYIDAAAMRYPNYHLYLIGHSLGGAVAQLYGSMFKLMHTCNVTVISDGSPIVGNEAFANWMDAAFIHQGPWNSPREIYRVTHNGDIVPRIPFWNGYHQPSGEIYIASANGINPPVNQVWDCSGQQNPNCSWGNWRNCVKFSELLYRHRDYFLRLAVPCENTNSGGGSGNGRSNANANANANANNNVHIYFPAENQYPSFCSGPCQTASAAAAKHKPK